MDIESLREYCISKKNVTESFPFGDDTLVFKTDGKIFALVNLDGDLSINLKCEPALAIELRERYSSVIPGYHMNKKHWNTVYLDGSVPDKEIFSWIDHSYERVTGKSESIYSSHQIASPDIAVVEPAQHFKSSILMKLPKVTCGNKGTGVQICQVNNIYPSGFSGLVIKGERILRIPDHYLHPWRTVKYPIAC